MVTPEFRKASSRRRCSSVFRSNSMVEKVSAEGKKVTLVPVSGSPLGRFGASPVTFRGDTASPLAKRISWILPSRQIFRSSQSDRALTTLTPTPCRPPETL